MCPDVSTGCVTKPRPLGMRADQRAALAAEGGVAKVVLRVHVTWVGLGEVYGADGDVSGECR